MIRGASVKGLPQLVTVAARLRLPRRADIAWWTNQAWPRSVRVGSGYADWQRHETVGIGWSESRHGGRRVSYHGILCNIMGDVSENMT
jgi:hypothetical protein